MFPLPGWATGKAMQAIAILLLIAAIIYGVRSWLNDYAVTNQNIGIAMENKVWVDREKLRVDTQNKKIDELEKAAKDKADKHERDMKARDARIAELDAKLEKEKKRVNTIVYRSDGSINNGCPAGTEIYLGSNFSKLWNDYNKGIMQ